MSSIKQGDNDTA